MENNTGKYISFLILFIYLGLIYLLYPVVGNSLLIISVVPVLIITWFNNYKYGLILQLFLILNHFIVLNIFDADISTFIKPGFIIGTSFNFALIFAFAYFQRILKSIKLAEKEIKNSNLFLTKTKEKLAESEHKYKTAFRTSPDAVNINTMDGIYVDINEGFTRLTGYTQEDVIGRSSSEINIWTIPKDREVLINALKENGKIENLESVFRCKDGSLKTALMSANIIEINKEPHILSITRDISEIKNKNNELLKAKEKAEESDKLKSSFLANMSHEIRTPMNSILGFSSLLKNPNLIDSKKEKFIEIINSSGKRLLTIISDIVDISKIDAKQLKLIIQECNLNNLIENLYEQFLISKINNSVSLKTKKTLSNNESFIKTDETRLMQVLSNLLENAEKFTSNGMIEFGYEIVEKNKAALIQFFVKDTGIGIDAEDQKIIFERFRQAESQNSESGSGTGLGLSIAKGLVELLNGKIWVESELNKGTVFYFTIPYYPVKHNDNIHESNDIDVINTNNEITILIAEDNISNFIYLEELLSQYNYNIIYAENGLEAVRKFKMNDVIDLVLMDVKMPIMNGFDATQEIRKINKNIPIIAQTAYAMSEDNEKAINSGCSDYLSKPISFDKLTIILKKYIKK